MNQKICFVIPGWVTKHTGGAELQCYLLSEELIKRGWEVEVFTYKDRIVSKKYLNKKINYIYYKTFKIIFINFIYSFFLLFKTDSKYYYIRTDARFLRAALVLFAKINKKKVIYALAHDDDAKNISYLSVKLKSNKKFFKKICHLVDASVVDFFAHRSINYVDMIIAQSEQQKKILKEFTGLTSFVIHNSFNYNRYSKIKKENIIIWVANMRPFKRPEIFLELAKKFENSDWQFIMIGNSSNDVKREM